MFRLLTAGGRRAVHRPVSSYKLVPCWKEMATDYTHAVVGLGLARLYATKPMRGRTGDWPHLADRPGLDVFSQPLTALCSAIGD